MLAEKNKVLKKDDYELFILETLVLDETKYLLTVEVDLKTESIGNTVIVLEEVGAGDKVSVKKVEDQALLEKLAPMFQELLENSELKEVTHE